jgi:TatD DNase family protein
MFTAPRHPRDLTAVLRRALDCGVRRIIITGTSLQDSRAALELARSVNASAELPGLRLFCTCGVHPTSTSQLEQGSAAAYEAELLQLAREGMADGTCVAIGECGLDMDRTAFSSAEAQRRHFPLHLRLAEATGLPLFLHDRNTGGELLRALPAGVRGVVHSFTGSAEELQALLAVPGLLVGLNGCGLKTAQACAVAAAMPLQRLLLESDAPWCSLKRSGPCAELLQSSWPAVDRKKWSAEAMVKDRNEPCITRCIAEAYAALAGQPLAEVARATEANVDRLFFPSPEPASAS